MRGAEGEAVVDEGGVNHNPLLGPVEQVVEVAQVPEAASHAVAGRIFVQCKHLPRTEPALRQWRCGECALGTCK